MTLVTLPGTLPERIKCGHEAPGITYIWDPLWMTYTKQFSHSFVNDQGDLMRMVDFVWDEEKDLGTQIFARGDITGWPHVSTNVEAHLPVEKSFKLSFVQNGFHWKLVDHNIGSRYVTEHWQGRLLSATN